jgi:DMSO/TMAO reductase YedYZ molybdopterin-dependent catalytic subunit
MNWPRRVPGLPPGQRLLTSMPRFTDAPFRSPPVMPASALISFSVQGVALADVGIDDLEAIGFRDVVADFHCVTTWSVIGVTWTGVPLTAVLASIGVTEEAGRFVVARAADHRRATLVWDDAVAPDVLLATHLDGVPLGPRHGGPVRLVAPQQYGYKSVKYLERIDIRPNAPRRLGKEHLRGRVALEERHPKLPSYLVKLPYRMLIAPTAAIAERSLNRQPGDQPGNQPGHQPGKQLANAEHHRSHWVINKIAPDFTLEDAWCLPGRGGPRDFPVFLDAFAKRDRDASDSKLVLALFRIRELLGTCFGWDDEAARALPIPGCTEISLASRLPAELRGSGDAVRLVSPSFIPLYQTDDEWAAEISNGTVHAAMHVAWVEQSDGNFAAQMGVYVKPRGRFGHAYMRFIRPFRHRIVYPAMMRQLEARRIT